MVLAAPATAQQAQPLTTRGGGGAVAAGAKDFDMGPPTTPEVVEKAVAMIEKPLPAGPFAATWDSLAKHYTVPTWFTEARFGLFLHFGVYSVPAYHNEWYEKHM